MNLTRIKILLLISILFISRLTLAQVDTIGTNQHPLLTSELTSGTRSYAVWQENERTGKITQTAIWNRTTSFEKLNGHDVVIVEQSRYYSDSINNKYVYTVSDKNTLHTIYDYTKRIRTGIEAYNYYQNEIIGADSIPDNTKTSFFLPLSDMPFCFEMDLETLGILPIKRQGQKFLINFYHPGGSIPPKYYPVEVLGSEDIYLSDYSIPCWKIRLTYSEDSYDISWIDINTHEVLKLEGHYSETILHKSKLM